MIDERGKERRTLGSRECFECFEFGFAEFARRHIHHAAQRDVVLEQCQTQIGYAVFYFLALKEAYAAPYFVGQLLFHQRLLYKSRLVAGAVEYGKIGGLATVLQHFRYGRSHPFAFSHLIGSVVMHHYGICRNIGAQVFGHAMYIILNHRISHIEDIGCGTVVFVENNIGIGFEIHKKFGSRAAPFVDSLVGVAHYEQIAALLAQHIDYAPIVAATVLHLIYLYVVEFALPVLARIGEIFENI